MQRDERERILLVPYPSQGHIHPMLQFAKRLWAHGLRPILAVTRHIFDSTKPEPGPVDVRTISDGFDQLGFAQARDVSDYLARLESAGSKTVEDLIRAEEALGPPIRVLIYDSFLPWALEVARRVGLPSAAFFTQSCAVDGVFGRAFRAGPEVLATELPALALRDLPSFFADRADGPYAAYLKMVLMQFSNLEKADEVFINSFFELEPEEAKWMESTWGAKTIGPTLPSKYLDDRISGDTHYGFHLFHPADDACMQWLAGKPPNSVVYVSFGSMAKLSPKSMQEIAQALLNTSKPFLWVVRQSEMKTLPENFTDQASEIGLVVSWSPQLEVLSHEAVGCFVTHCGWNSTLEAIAIGVPMVGVPQWTDQPTNAKYVEDVWRVGVRVKTHCDEKEEEVVVKEEIERCIREVMEGEKSEEIRRNVRKWKELAKEAVSEGGSSDRNVDEFVAKYCSRTSEILKS